REVQHLTAEVLNIREEVGGGQVHVPGVEEGADGVGSGYLATFGGDGNDAGDFLFQAVHHGGAVGCVFNENGSGLGPACSHVLNGLDGVREVHAFPEHVEEEG